MAKKYWLGAAQAVAQVTTVTYSAYTIGVTYRLTVNNKVVSYTAVAATSADVWAGMVNAWNSSGFAEIQEMVASVGGAGIVLTGRDAGVPVTVTGSSSGAPTATVTATTAATGPNFLMNAANWVGGTAPVAADELIFRNSSVSVLYDIEQTGINFSHVTVEASFTGAIGLPATRENGAAYPEYRPRYLKLGDGTNTYNLTIGAGVGQQASRVLVDANQASVTLVVFGSGQASLDAMPVELKNTDSASAAQIYAGNVAIRADTTGNLATLAVIFRQDLNAQPNVIIGEGVTVAAAKQLGNSTLSNYGTITVMDVVDGAECYNYATMPTARAANQGKIYWVSSANLSTQAIAYSMGLIDFSRHGTAKSCQACDVYGGGSVLDPLGLVTFTTGIILKGCKLADTTIDVGRSRTLTIT